MVYTYSIEQFVFRNIIAAYVTTFNKQYNLYLKLIKLKYKNTTINT